MNLQEEIIRLLQTYNELSFVEPFLKENPKAELYLVGGAVRDILLKRKTKKMDFDFVVRLLDKNEIEKWFGARGKIDFVGKNFGVYKFLSTIDIALPRTEHPSSQSLGGYKDFEVQSDPKMQIKKDLSRRDFTINAMAINMRSFELIDPFDGLNDISKRIIKAVGKPKDRFKEDLSRMLRAIRFATELNFTIEEKTLRAIKEQIIHINDKRKILPEPVEGSEFEYVVPRETVGHELAKALASNPKLALEHLLSIQTLELFIKPKPELIKPILSLTQAHPTLTVSLLLRNLSQEEIKKTLSLAGLDSLPRETEYRIEPDDVLWLIARLQENLNAQSVAQMRASKFEDVFMNPKSRWLIQALRALNQNETADSAKKRANEIRTRWSVEDDEQIPALLSGNEILNAGVQPGPKVRELLSLLRDEQLDGRILTREKAKEWLIVQI